MSDRPVSVHSGQIYWHGVARSRDEADRLARQFEGVTDWFAPTAHQYARELRAALEQTDATRRAA